jgi:4-hydroxythreonine-4-phosphate dehydrogenase
MPKMLIIADDLTGATDSAAACAEYGMETIVLLGKPDGHHAGPETAEVLAIDANTRCLAADEAAKVTAKTVQRYGRIGAPTDQALLFKKVDSTLRGHVAVELAAVLNARREQASSGQRVVALLAPAFPAQGRTTVRGRQLLNGIPLEDADSWKGERVRPRSNIAGIVGEAGLACGVIELATVRSGPHSLDTALSGQASTVDVIVCDAATDADLRAIAISSVALGPRTVLAGSAGLARYIPLATGFGRAGGAPGRDREIAFEKGPTLFVVGSLSDASRKQAQSLAAEPDVETFTNPQHTLLKNDSNAWREYAGLVSKTLERGKDVLLMFDSAEQFTPPQIRLLTNLLARMLQPLADHVGALIATGGETARTVLQAWGVSQLRLLGEVTPGLPYCVTERWRRDILVLTKAGSFGTQNSLLDCRNFIRTIERNRRRIAEPETVVENQKN